MQQRLLPAVSLGVLTLVTVALWVVVFTRSPSSTPSTEGPASDVVTATAEADRGSSPSGSAGEDPSPSPSGDASSDAVAVELASTSYEAAPFETVALEGTVEGAEPGTSLRVQHRRGDRWVPFPLPAVTDADGRFTAHVELGTPGSHRLRVIEPETRVTSPVVTVEIG